MADQTIKILTDQVNALNARVSAMEQKVKPNTITWHTHTGKDLPKVKPTDLEAWNFIQKKPSQTSAIANGQWQAFMPADIGIYVTGFGWCTLSFVNAFVQMTEADATIAASGTLQLFTGVTIADNQSEMGQNVSGGVAGTFTAKTFGWYQVNISVLVDKNGTLTVKKNTVDYASSDGTDTILLSRMIQLETGDTLTFHLTNNDGVSSMDLTGTLLNTELDIYKLSNVNS